MLIGEQNEEIKRILNDKVDNRANQDITNTEYIAFQKSSRKKNVKIIDLIDMNSTLR